MSSCCYGQQSDCLVFHSSVDFDNDMRPGRLSEDVVQDLRKVHMNFRLILVNSLLRLMSYAASTFRANGRLISHLMSL